MTNTPEIQEEITTKPARGGAARDYDAKIIEEFRANKGSPGHPDWYYTLKANPLTTVETGTGTFTVLARDLDDAARTQLWPKLAEYPTLGKHQARTTRQIPVIILTRQD